MNELTTVWYGSEEPPICSEDEVLALIDSVFPKSDGHFPAGRGDDCAELVDLPSTLAVSTDMFWQDSHFRIEYVTPEEVGSKALVGAVSDLAATGATPLGFSLGLHLAPGIAKSALRGIFGGMADTAAKYGMSLTGGDIMLGRDLGFSLCVWGKSCLDDGGFARRGRIAPGDVLWLLGEVGLSRIGLWALERMGRNAFGQWPASCAAFLYPQALLDGGQRILRAAAESQSQERLSMMDVSDGLARDLPRLLGKYGATLELPANCIPPEVRSAAPFMGMTPEDLALLGGEDYSLLGSCPKSLWPALQSAAPGIYAIGRVTTDSHITHQGKPLPGKGFDHFTAASATKLRLREQADQLIDLGKQAWQIGLMAGFNGNISCHANNSDTMLITRSGASKGRLQPSDFALISLDDGSELVSVLPSSPLPPSSETSLHLAIYAACPDSLFVLHCHSPKMLALSLALPPDQRLRLPGVPEAERYRDMMVIIPFYPPGSQELAEAVALAARKYPAIWMERHGLVVHGRDPVAVLALCEELEQLAEAHCLLLSVNT
jgi:thiamine-monophosphate kinase